MVITDDSFTNVHGNHDDSSEILMIFNHDFSNTANGNQRRPCNRNPVIVDCKGRLTIETSSSPPPFLCSIASAWLWRECGRGSHRPAVIGTQASFANPPASERVPHRKSIIHLCKLYFQLLLTTSLGLEPFDVDIDVLEPAIPFAGQSNRKRFARTEGRFIVRKWADWWRKVGSQFLGNLYGGSGKVSSGWLDE